MTGEPVLTATTMGAIVSAVLALLVSFGVELASEQIEAILTLVAVVAPVVLSAVYARSRVSPVERRGPNTRA